MFKYEEICELIRLVSSTNVASVEIEHAGTRLRIDGPAPVSVTEAAAAKNLQAVQPEAISAATPHATDDTPAGELPVASEDERLHWVSSPIVGTFYRAPNPDSDPYVRVGDFVEQGQTLCIVEAMKLMNEIETDVTGTIVKVLPENSQPVEYGERLFGVRFE
jgi:acetyl-CoA carboxylase biotin carboxyl carrier protein